MTFPELEPVRLHVQNLMATPGVTGRAIAAAAGVNDHSVFRLASGHKRTLARPVAEAIAGVTLQACLERDHRSTSLVDGVGTVRRLRALARDGWSPAIIGGLTGTTAHAVRKHRQGNHPEITMGCRERYRDLYDKIQSQADPRGDSDETRRYAESAGWLGPERWADEDIDNPLAEPLPPPPETEDWVLVTRMIEGALRDPRPGKAAEYPRHIQREIARQASGRLGWSYTRIAELLGATGKSTVEYLLYGRKDRPRTRREAHV